MGEAKQPGERAYEAYWRLMNQRRDRGLYDRVWVDLSPVDRECWAEAEQAGREWIPVTVDTMPEPGSKVVFWCSVWRPDATPGIGLFSGEHWEDETQRDASGEPDRHYSGVTHWYPLPSGRPQT